MDRFYNKHKGKVGIVAGTGPSLRHMTEYNDLTSVLIAVNGAIVKCTAADYFICGDPRIVLFRTWSIIKTLYVPVVLVRPAGYMDWDGYDKQTGEPYDKGLTGRIIHLQSRLTGQNLSFEYPGDGQLVFAHSTAFSAAHLASLLGCNPILLIGCDCGPEDDKHYFYEFPGQEEYANDVTYPGIEPQLQNTPILPSFAEHWSKIAEANPRVEFINCGSAVIPNIAKMSFEEVLKRYG